MVLARDVLAQADVVAVRDVVGQEYAVFVVDEWGLLAMAAVLDDALGKLALVVVAGVGVGVGTASDYRYHDCGDQFSASYCDETMKLV